MSVRSLALIPGVGDLALLWRRPGATALIPPLAWELPYVVGGALKSKKKKKKKDVMGRLVVNGLSIWSTASEKISKIQHRSGVPFMAQQLANLTRVHEDVGSIPDLVHWVGDPVLL